MTTQTTVIIDPRQAEIEHSKQPNDFGFNDVLGITDGDTDITLTMPSSAHAELAAMLLDGFDHSDERERALELFNEVWREPADADMLAQMGETA